MLKGKTALVTGSTSGIGLGVATALAEAGANIVLNGFGDAADIERIRSTLAERTGVQVIHSGADMGQPEEIAAMFRMAASQVGEIDVLVNNAGISHRSAFVDTDLEVFRRVMAVNYFGALNCTMAVLPSLITRHGQIIVLSSLSGFAPLLYRSAYNASKHALHGLFETLRYEIKGSGVNIMLVCPGFTATDLRKNALVGDSGLASSPPLAMGRVASAHDVAEEIYRAGLKRKRLLVLSNVNWRARLLARYFPWLFERALLPRISGIKPGRRGR